MPFNEPQVQPDRITKSIVNSLAEHFADPEFDDDAGMIRFLDRDESCIWLGLFPTNDNGDVATTTPTVTWTIEVSCEGKATDD